MKGKEFITKLQNREIETASISLEDIKDNDIIELFEHRIYRNVNLIGYYHST